MWDDSNSVAQTIMGTPSPASFFHMTDVQRFEADVSSLRFSWLRLEPSSFSLSHDLFSSHWELLRDMNCTCTSLFPSC